MSEVSSIVSLQRAWARAIKLECNGAGPRTVAANLFYPMHSATIAEFVNGDGGELGTTARPGKMRSLRSSSALAVNFFDHWRYRPLAPLAAALKLDGEFVEFHFEQKFPTGLRGTRPNIDLAFFPLLGSPVGIECKFCEPYDSRTLRPPIDLPYFPAGRALWGDTGLPLSQATAEALGHAHNYTHLDAGQLLKHILGLSRTYPDMRPIRLLYLRFDYACPAADRHREEITAFAQRVEGEISFRATTYQQVFERLRVNTAVDQQYLSLLQRRYFPGALNEPAEGEP